MSRSCLITGATGALGSALSRAFAGEGYRLILCGRSSRKLAQLAAELPQGTDITPVAVDLAAPEAAEIIGRAADSAGGADVLINNAAIHGPIGPLVQSDFNEWALALTIDLIRPAALIRRLAPHMIARGWGRIINIAGGGASKARPSFSAYAAAKTALVRLSETLAEELGPLGLTVNSISPGIMKSALTDEILAEKDKAGPAETSAVEKLKAQGGAPPSAAAALCLFLCRAEAAGINGRMISAVWDDYLSWPEHQTELAQSDLYTLRRITARDKGFSWGDK